MFRQRRGPVVAARHVHVEPVLEVEAGQAIERVDLLLLLVERVGRLAIRILQRVDARYHQPADKAGARVQVVHAGVAPRIHRDRQVLEQRPVGGDEEVAVGFAVGLAHVQDAAPVIRRDVVHGVVRPEMVLVPVTAGATGGAQPVVEPVRDGNVAEPAVARVVGRLHLRFPEWIGVVAVVPAVLDGRVRAQVVALKDLLREGVVQVAVEVLLQQLRVDLPTEPDEPLHRVDLLVRLGRLVLHRVVDVVDRCLRAPPVRDLRRAGDRHVRAGVVVARVHPALARTAHR